MNTPEIALRQCHQQAPFLNSQVTPLCQQSGISAVYSGMIGWMEEGLVHYREGLVEPCT